MKIRRWLVLLCTFMLAVTAAVPAVSRAATSVPAALYTRIDPSTGKIYNLKGKTVYIYDWWTGTDWHDTEPETNAEKAVYNYRIWLEETYNCKIVETAKGDWDSQVDELQKIVKTPGKNLCVFTIGMDFMSKVMLNNLAADWKKGVSISLSDGKWNKSTMKLMSFANGIYGVSTSKTEPRECLFFNKRVLKEAGIDWNQLYNMQKAGKWTWDQFTKLLDKVDKSGAYGLVGSTDMLYRIAVFSNGGSFFDLDASGELVATVSSEQSKQALNWAKQLWNKYSAPQPEGTNWDWYKETWNEGNTGFYIGQAWQGFNPGSEFSGLKDEWGCVAFPKGPKGDGYVTIASNNVMIIPASYTKAQISQVSMIYDLWTSPAPGWVGDEDELANLLGMTDNRAIYETYRMLQQNGEADKTYLLGSVNDILGTNLLWPLSAEDLDALIESAKQSWEGYLKTLKEIIGKLLKENTANTIKKDGLLLELDKTDKTAKVVGAEKKTAGSLTIPDQVKAGKKTYKVTGIADQAFKGMKKLATVKIGKNVKSIGKEAFKACVKLKKVSGGTGLVVLGDGAFSGCTALTSITLEKNVASLGDEIFIKCKNLKTIKIKTTKLNDDVVGKNAFKNISKKAVFDCPDELVEKYSELMGSKGAPKTAKYK